MLTITNFSHACNYILSSMNSSSDSPSVRFSQHSHYLQNIGCPRSSFRFSFFFHIMNSHNPSSYFIKLHEESGAYIIQPFILNKEAGVKSSRISLTLFYLCLTFPHTSKQGLTCTILSVLSHWSSVFFSIPAQVPRSPNLPAPRYLVLFIRHTLPPSLQL